MSAHLTQQAEVPEPEAARYAVIDLASTQSLRPIITALKPAAAEPLFARSFAPELLEVGPWLVRLSKTSEIARALTRMGADVHWGYFIYTTVDIALLCQSLRRFNLARIPDMPDKMLFRYWDPRVMRVFLEVASHEQRARLFEGITCIEVAGVNHYADIDDN